MVALVAVAPLAVWAMLVAPMGGLAVVMGVESIADESIRENSHSCTLHQRKRFGKVSAHAASTRVSPRKKF